jgi:cell division protein FtsW (lipid II flippase)
MTKESEIPGRLDWLILLIMTALLMFSVPIVYSASSTIGFTKYGSSEKFLMSQVLRVFIALGITILASRID